MVNDAAKDDAEGIENSTRKMMRGGRKFGREGVSGEGKRDPPRLNLRLRLGEKATSGMLASRACPEGLSPKRPVPMDVDQTPPIMQKKKKRTSIKHTSTPTPTQRKLTDMWKVDGDDEVGKDKVIDN